MDAPCARTLREAAIGAAHDVFAPDDLGEPDDTFGNQFSPSLTMSMPPFSYRLLISE